MITLQTKQAGAALAVALKIETVDCSAVIAVAVERDAENKVKPIRKMVNGEWVEDTKRCRQVVSWVDQGGDTWRLTGAVNEAEAIDLGTGRVGRVVVEVTMDEASIGAREKGGQSRDVNTVQIRRILEVWETPDKALYTHPDHKRK